MVLEIWAVAFLAEVRPHARGARVCSSQQGLLDIPSFGPLIREPIATRERSLAIKFFGDLESDRDRSESQQAKPIYIRNTVTDYCYSSMACVVERYIRALDAKDLAKPGRKTIPGCSFRQDQGLASLRRYPHQPSANGSEASPRLGAALLTEGARRIGPLGVSWPPGSMFGLTARHAGCSHSPVTEVIDHQGASTS